MNQHNTPCDLSCIIITRNEEEYIGECIKSVLSSLNHALSVKAINSYEIILVDSASTDGTIEIAKNYPMNILQLDPSWPLSAAAGAYIGFLNSKGKYVASIDGDMVLHINWFKEGIIYMEQNIEVAAVTGKMIHVRNGNHVNPELPLGELESIFGAIIFRKSVLDKVGPINPYVGMGGEEPELSFRIRVEGHKIMRIAGMLLYHHDIPLINNYFHFFEKRFRYSMGGGQGMRLSLRNKKIFNMYIKLYKYNFIFMGWVFIGVYGCIYNLLYNNPFYIYLASFLYIGILSKIINKSKNISDILILNIELARKSIGIMIGFLNKPKNINSYPTDVKIIKCRGIVNNDTYRVSKAHQTEN